MEQFLEEFDVVQIMFVAFRFLPYARLAGSLRVLAVNS